MIIPVFCICLGLCLKGFIDAFFIIAKKRFSAGTLLESVSRLLSYCEMNLEEEKKKPQVFPNISRGDPLRLDVGDKPVSATSQKSHKLDYRSFSHEPRRLVRPHTVFSFSQDFASKDQ